MFYCPQCGKANLNNAILCDTCGASLEYFIDSQPSVSEDDANKVQPSYGFMIERILPAFVFMLAGFIATIPGIVAMRVFLDEMTSTTPSVGPYETQLRILATCFSGFVAAVLGAKLVKSNHWGNTVKIGIAIPWLSLYMFFVVWTIFYSHHDSEGIPEKVFLFTFGAAFDTIVGMVICGIWLIPLGLASAFLVNFIAKKTIST